MLTLVVGAGAAGLAALKALTDAGDTAEVVCLSMACTGRDLPVCDRDEPMAHARRLAGIPRRLLGWLRLHAACVASRVWRHRRSTRFFARISRVRSAAFHDLPFRPTSQDAFPQWTEVTR